MSSGYKRPLSPLAARGSRPLKVPRPSNPTKRVALAGRPQRMTASQTVQEEDGASVFAFGDARGISLVSFT